MQVVNPQYTKHSSLKECQTGMDLLRQGQGELVVDSAQALRHHVSVHGEVLERVEVFK
jgi:hypothetical protein